MPGPYKGTNPGTYRTTQGASRHHIICRDDIWFLIDAKAKREGRSKRSVIEAALYYYVGGESLPIPHPDDPQFADTNMKRAAKEHAPVTDLDTQNREAMNRGIAREEADKPDNPWNQ